MLFVYFNYPNSRVVVHSDPSCPKIRQHRKPGQRTVSITPSTVDKEKQMFGDPNGYRFESTAGLNDMWLELDLGDRAGETTTLKDIHRILAGRYKPFAKAEINRCC